MTDYTEQSYQVLVILDPDFGERLRQSWTGQPIWIVTSPANDPVMRALWASNPNLSHLTGITGLSHYQDEGREGCFLAYLNTIELHHGAMSSDTPFTVMNVIGVPLTPAMQQALEELGFTTFSKHSEGFNAVRTPAEAARIRD